MSLNPIRVLILLLLLGLAVFANSFSNKFMIDDYSFLGNPHYSQQKYIWSQWIPHHIEREGVSDPYLANQTYYRPLAHMIIAGCYSSFGDTFWKYHLFNLLFFVMAAWLIYLLLFRITGQGTLAALSAVFYLVHPINGVVVNYITAGIFAFEVIFITASLLLAWEAWRRHYAPFYVASMMCFILALGCHETAVMTPFYLSAVMLTQKDFNRGKVLKFLTPFFLLLVSYLIFRVFFISFKGVVVGGMSSLQMNGWEYGATLFSILFWFISKLFYCHGIVLVWSIPVVRDYTALFFGGFLALMLLWGGLWIYFRSQKIVQMALLWILFGFLPVGLCAFTRPFEGVNMEPHWFVFSVIGFFIMMAHCILVITPKDLWTRAAIVCGLIFIWASISILYNRSWANEKTYASYWSSQVPHLYSIDSYLAHAYFLDGELNEAKKHYHRALLGKANQMTIYNSLGMIEQSQGDARKAEGYFLKALKYAPDSAYTHHNLGVLYLSHEEREKAKEHLLRSIQLNPHDPFPLRALTKLYWELKDDENVKKYACASWREEDDPETLKAFSKMMVMYNLPAIAELSEQKAKGLSLPKNVCIE